MSKKAEYLDRAYVDVEPFRELLRDWLDRRTFELTGITAGASGAERMLLAREYGTTMSDFTSPRARVCKILWPDATEEAAERQLTRLLNEVTSIHFDIADRIVCGVLCDPALWIADERLAEIYENVSLVAVDLRDPTCESAAEEVREKILETYATLKSGPKVAAALGISKRQTWAVCASVSA